MSKSLIKLIDTAIIPAAIMILGKVAGLCFANTVFNLNWGITSDPNNFFSVNIQYATLAEQITATSYSNLIMYLFVFIGFLVILLRALYFNSSHISPSLVAKLATNNLLNLITDSFEIYKKASVWLVILWLALFALLINVIIGKAYPWTGILCIMCTFITTTVLLKDVSREISIARKSLNKLPDDNLKTS